MHVSLSKNIIEIPVTIDNSLAFIIFCGPRPIHEGLSLFILSIIILLHLFLYVYRRMFVEFRHEAWRVEQT